MTRLTLTVLMTATLSIACRVPDRSDAIETQRPTKTQQPQAPSDDQETADDQGPDNGPFDYPSENENDDPADDNSATGIISQFRGDRIEVTPGSADSITTLTFKDVNQDARKIYKSMAVATKNLPTVDGYENHTIKIGQGIACHRYYYAPDNSSRTYRCELRFKSRTGEVLNATETITAAEPEETLTSDYAGEVASISSNSATLNGELRIGGTEAKVLFDNLSTQAQGGTKSQGSLHCSNDGEVYSCRINFGFAEGRALPAS